MKEHAVDALLLDIQMPDITGIELLQTLLQPPKVIFTTAYTEYALQSFDFDHVIDYLNKPIRLPRFIKAMERLKIQLDLESNAAEASSLVVNNQKVGKLETLVVKEDKVTYRIPVLEIDYIQSWGNYVKIFTNNNQVRLARKTITDLEKELKTNGFERVHKSYLVNKKSVKAINGNQLILQDQTLPIGGAYRLLVKERLLK
ncbi:LytR/AlgR family response regulator transcription factor [Psychroflexus gondwanensis]|uniref:LytR/AlgR family response regulator transcription factor n=1 Tax=Psychroflexus gondwanensis TaxID=251 RepID=UPI0003A2A4FC|nr:LytTR family DNA-binding domain-containing protein [Psychroflexus gondwanensis]